MRAGLLLSLAWADYRGEARLSLCAIFALAAVITPLLVLFGLKYGLVSTLTERLERAPSVREIIPVGGARYRAEDIAALAARADVAFAVPRTRQIAATADLSGGGETALSVEMIPSAAGDPLLAGLPQPDRPTRVVLSHGAAEKLGAQPGERIVARIGRRMDGQAQSQRLELEVLAVLPQFIDPHQPLLAQYLIMGGTMIVVDLIVMAGYTGLAARVLRVLRSPRQQKLVNRTFASLFVGAAGLLATVRRAPL